MTPFKTHPLLEDESVCHGFFGRQGGVSEGLYASLNTGLGSDDDPNNLRSQLSQRIAGPFSFMIQKPELLEPAMQDGAVQSLASRIAR